MHKFCAKCADQTNKQQTLDDSESGVWTSKRLRRKKKNTDDYVVTAFFDAHRVGTFLKANEISFPEMQKLLESMEGARRTGNKRGTYDQI